MRSPVLYRAAQETKEQEDWQEASKNYMLCAFGAWISMLTAPHSACWQHNCHCPTSWLSCNVVIWCLLQRMLENANAQLEDRVPCIMTYVASCSQQQPAERRLWYCIILYIPYCIILCMTMYCCRRRQGLLTYLAQSSSSCLTYQMLHNANH